jgi:hypothetical protein
MGLAEGLASNGVALGSSTGLATTASPTFTGTVTNPDGGTETSSANVFVAPVTLPSGTAGTVLHAATVSASGAINSTETLLLNIALVAGATLKVGSKVRVVADGTCTASAANVPTFTLRAGTLGTKSDASVAAIALAVSGVTGTAVPFRAVIEMTVQTLGAAGTCFGSLVLLDGGTGLTGLSATAIQVVPFTSATLATTTATFLDITFVTAASTTTATFQDVSIEVIP